VRPKLRAAALPAAFGLASLFIVGGAVANIDCLARTSTFCRLSAFTSPAVALDVPYVTTRSGTVAQMLELAQVGPQDYLIDLGTGDGRILIAAARDRGARGLGVDIDPARVSDARANARREGVSNRVSFLQQNLFETPLSGASVIAMYLLPEINLKLRPKLLAELRPGARIVSHEFDMGEWEPDGVARLGSSDVYLWIVPALATGRWTLLENGKPAGSLEVTQRFQNLAGTLSHPGGSVAIEDGRIIGDKVQFSAGGRSYEGVVRQDRIDGRGWRADRARES
jgi:hypothetical protein